MTEITGSEARRMLIFEAIESLLSEGDVENLTYANISARCHLHASTITYYFESKEDMMLHFFEHLVKRDSAMKPGFFYRVEGDTTPVEAFSAYIDHIVDCKHLQSEVRRLMNLYLLPNLYASDAVRNLILHVNKVSTQAEYDAIEVYKELGIIEESRVEAAFADLIFTAYGNSLLIVFGLECPYAGRALHDAKERLKKSFLKDDLYVETPYSEDK